MHRRWCIACDALQVFIVFSCLSSIVIAFHYMSLEHPFDPIRSQLNGPSVSRFGIFLTPSVRHHYWPLTNGQWPWPQRFEIFGLLNSSHRKHFDPFPTWISNTSVSKSRSLLPSEVWAWNGETRICVSPAMVDLPCCLLVDCVNAMFWVGNILGRGGWTCALLRLSEAGIVFCGLSTHLGKSQLEGESNKEGPPLYLSLVFNRKQSINTQVRSRWQ